MMIDADPHLASVPGWRCSRSASTWRLLLDTSGGNRCGYPEIDQAGSYHLLAVGRMQLTIAAQ